MDKCYVVMRDRVGLVLLLHCREEAWCGHNIVSADDLLKSVQWVNNFLIVCLQLCNMCMNGPLTIPMFKLLGQHLVQCSYLSTLEDTSKV